VKAGQELDALVAEKVMGQVECSAWRADRAAPVSYFKESGDCAHAACRPVGFVSCYSTNIAAAWDVVRRLTDVATPGHADDFTLQYEPRPMAWGAQFEPAEGAFPCDTAPLAICLAALKAVGVEVEERS
jgi:hypothetical protein